MPTAPERPRWKRWLRFPYRVLVFVSLTVVAFWLFEGLCSTIWVSTLVMETRLAAERLHTRYDSELGWVAIPNLALPNIYGPGLGLTTNALGFRGSRQVEPLPPGVVRVVCSGDSFTLGYGVDDLETWCYQLGSLDPRLDTVNMGQGGYGVDQAYLWYKRDGLPIHSQVHVFAFISEDLRRMTSSDFYGFGKPRLKLEDGRIVTHNVPVPRGAYRFPWLTSNRFQLRQLRSYALLEKLWLRIHPPVPPPPSVDTELDLLFAILEDLRSMDREKGSALLVAYLPTYSECLTDSDEALRHRLASECTRRGLDFIDLAAIFTTLPAATLEQMYLPGWPPSRHLSARGHLLVARTLQSCLRQWEPPLTQGGLSADPTAPG